VGGMERGVSPTLRSCHQEVMQILDTVHTLYGLKKKNMVAYILHKQILTEMNNIYCMCMSSVQCTSEDKLKCNSRSEAYILFYKRN